jgi:hypothetical protein
MGLFQEISRSSDLRKKLSQIMLNDEHPGRFVSGGVQWNSTWELGKRIDAAIDSALKVGVRNANALNAR